MKKFFQSKYQHGNAAVEAAIVLPLVFILLMGIVEFSVLFYDKAVITNASREGARAGIVYHPNRDEASIDNAVTNAVQNYASGHMITFGTQPTITPVITYPDSGIGQGLRLVVQVDYPYEFLVFQNILELLPGDQNFSDTLTLHAITEMRME